MQNRRFVINFFEDFVSMYNASPRKYTTTKCNFSSYLLLRFPLFPDGLVIWVDTIWQWTVPMSNIRHKGPSTSLTFTIGIIKYNTSARTEKKRFQNVKYKERLIFISNLSNYINFAVKTHQSEKYEEKAHNIQQCNPPAHQLSENLRP